jgi:predicted peptidase
VERKDNIVVMDWSKFALNPSYSASAKKADQVAEILVKFLKNLVKEKFVEDYSNIHIVGFSVGGHIG